MYICARATISRSPGNFNWTLSNIAFASSKRRRLKTLTACSNARNAPEVTWRRGGSGGGGAWLTIIGNFTLPLDLDLIAVALITRRPFDDSPGLDLALTGAGVFLAVVFRTNDRVLTCLFATTFFWALAGLNVALGFGAGFLDDVFSFLDEVFGVVFTAFFIRAVFATFLATFAVEILLCFDTEAVWAEAGFFFFSSFFSFELSFEMCLELVLAAATFLYFVLPFWRLESVSLITFSFC